MARRKRNTRRGVRQRDMIRSMVLGFHQYRPSSLLFGPSDEVYDPLVGGSMMTFIPERRPARIKGGLPEDRLVRFVDEKTRPVRERVKKRVSEKAGRAASWARERLPRYDRLREGIDRHVTRMRMGAWRREAERRNMEVERRAREMGYDEYNYYYGGV